MWHNRHPNAAGGVRSRRWAAFSHRNSSALWAKPNGTERLWAETRGLGSQDAVPQNHHPGAGPGTWQQLPFENPSFAAGTAWYNNAPADRQAIVQKISTALLALFQPLFNRFLPFSTLPLAHSHSPAHSHSTTHSRPRRTTPRSRTPHVLTHDAVECDLMCVFLTNRTLFINSCVYECDLSPAVSRSFLPVHHRTAAAALAPRTCRRTHLLLCALALRSAKCTLRVRVSFHFPTNSVDAGPQLLTIALLGARFFRTPNRTFWMRIRARRRASSCAVSARFLHFKIAVFRTLEIALSIAL